MREFEYTIKDPVGIHARPAGMLVQKAKGLASAVTLEKGGKKADAKKLFSVMTLCAKQGDTLLVRCDGADEENAAAELQRFFEENL